MSFRFLPPRRVVPVELTAQQQDLAQLKRSPQVVFGSPGTGKTTLAATAAAKAVQGGMSLDRVIVLAQSRSAAQRLRREISFSLPGAQTSAQVTTVHGLALGFLKRFWPHEDEQWQLLRAPEQEVRIRELLAALPSELWPPSTRAAIGTRAFARQLRDVLARARQLTLDPEVLREFAKAADDELFESAGEFMERYLTIGDFSATLDYAELVYRTRLLLTEDAVRDAVRGSFEAIIVDDAQELDHAQTGLIADLIQVGLSSLIVGDPTQRIGGFRGASSSGMAELANLPGAEQHRLHQGFRCPAAVVEGLDSLAWRLGAEGVAQLPVQRPGNLTARVFDDESAELAQLAAELRESVAVDGLEWSDLAVVTRAGRRQLSVVAKELIRFGVPVDVAGDEIALAEQPAVATLLLALKVVARGGTPAADEARQLLSSPLVGMDGVAQRHLARDLLSRHRSSGNSMTLLSRSLSEPELLAELVGPEADSARQLAALLHAGTEMLSQGAEVQEVLWQLWDGTDWPTRLRDAALRGSRRADADLDAIVELFEVAARNSTLHSAAGAWTFIEEIAAQEIPADTGRELSLERFGVRVLTAHRTQGLQWRRVWIIGVQEGLWPRSSQNALLLDASRLGVEQISPSETSSSRSDERRLFYVAASRASESLSVSAVQGVDGEGGRPSRFLYELGVPVERRHGRPSQLLSAAALVGELRRVVLDETGSEGLRRSAALRLARLAELKTNEGLIAFPGADPNSWWGTAEYTENSPGPTGTIAITGSSLEALLECPRRWFLARRAAAETGRQSRASIGDVVHLLARESALRGLDAQQMKEQLDQVWEKIPFETEWLSATERGEIDAALERISQYERLNHDKLVAVEQEFKVELELDSGPVRLVGTVDRLERESSGELRIVDIKTGRRALGDADVVQHAQLGLYQLAAKLGAFDEVAPGERRVAAPALSFVRSGELLPQMAAQPSLDDAPKLPDEELRVGPTWVHDRIAEGVAIISEAKFDAVECSSCRFCQFTASCPALAARPKAGKQR